MVCVKESSMPYQRAMVIQEEKKPYVKHDQIFKELINNFFVEFLDVFFPEVHAGIDFLIFRKSPQYERSFALGIRIRNPYSILAIILFTVF